MAGFYAAGAHTWAASALLSAALSSPPLLPHALSPEEVTLMLLDHGAAIREIHEELVLLRELLTGRLPPPRASLLSSSAAALLTLSIGPFAVETVKKMLTRRCLRQCGCRLQHAASWRAGGWGGYSICNLFSPAPRRSSFRLFVATQRR
jgi:hypothetical protein